MDDGGGLVCHAVDGAGTDPLRSGYESIHAHEAIPQTDWLPPHKIKNRRSTH